MDDPRKKVIFVITKSNWGGAQRYVYDLATNLSKDTWDVTVAFGGTGEPDASHGALAHNLSIAKVEGIHVPPFMRDISISREFEVLRQLTWLFKNKRPDVIHLNSSKAGGIGALAGRRAGVKKIVFTSHGLPYDEDVFLPKKIFRWLATWATFLLCHQVILISQDTYKRARRFPFCKKKVHLIYNGIKQIDFYSREEARTNIIGKPRVDTLWIGTIGEFTRNKGYPYLVEAASILKNRGFSFRMSLVGWGEDISKIKQQAINEGLYNAPGSSAYIDLPGFVPDYARKLKAYEIFVLASVKEGLPYVLLEAGQAGCAVVASRIPGITDVIGDAGILVEPKNAEEIASSLEKLLKETELRQSLGKKLQERVQKEFSLEQMVEKTQALYLA